MSDGLCCKRAGRTTRGRATRDTAGSNARLKHHPLLIAADILRGIVAASTPVDATRIWAPTGRSQLATVARRASSSGKLLSHLSRFFSVRCRPKATLTMRRPRTRAPDFNPSIYKVVRERKRGDHGVYNCLASIVQDAAFVRRVVARCHSPCSPT